MRLNKLITTCFISLLIMPSLASAKWQKPLTVSETRVQALFAFTPKKEEKEKRLDPLVLAALVAGLGVLTVAVSNSHDQPVSP